MLKIKPIIKTVFSLFLFLIISHNVLAHDEVKIAVVNLDYIVANSPEGKSLQAKLENFQQLIQAEVEVKRKDVNSLRQRMVDGSNSLSQEQLNALQKQYEDIQISIKRYMDDKQREGQKMQNDGLKIIEASLEPVFNKIKSDNNYDLILNNVSGVVIMASDKVDITDTVIQILNSGH